MTDKSPLTHNLIIKRSLGCKCPKCGKGDLFNGFISTVVCDKCSSCDMKLSDHDCGDGPIFFLMFILCTVLVPMAMVVETMFSPPLWFHAVIWSIVSIGVCLGAMRPIKAYMIGLQLMHRPGDWEEE